jgi:acyl carrier protein phosphodiesterase
LNFLAHLYLSGPDEEIMVGNFMGDFVRGRNIYNQFPKHVALGIELHREIDEFTDNHAVVLESKIRLRPKYRHYAPVIIDMFYDHFLAVHWTKYHTKPLAEYAQLCYRVLQKFDSILPTQVKYLMPYMIEGNWLLNYAKLKGIHRALSGMARRTPYDSKMDEAIHELTVYRKDFENEFLRFFPNLEAMSKKFVELKVQGLTTKTPES